MSGINAPESIKGSISEISVLSGTISSGGSSLSGAVSAEASDTNNPKYDIYDGEYDVTPSVSEEQTLHTANKVLENDITVRTVPYIETSNPSNGITVYIGKDV